MLTTAPIPGSLSNYTRARIFYISGIVLVKNVPSEKK
jgi:hypothetical protein